jgi:hypothetical protein
MESWVSFATWGTDVVVLSYRVDKGELSDGTPVTNSWFVGFNRASLRTGAETSVWVPQDKNVSVSRILGTDVAAGRIYCLVGLTTPGREHTTEYSVATLEVASGRMTNQVALTSARF